MKIDGLHCIAPYRAASSQRIVPQVYNRRDADTFTLLSLKISRVVYFSENPFCVFNTHRKCLDITHIRLIGYPWKWLYFAPYTKSPWSLNSFEVCSWAISCVPVPWILLTSDRFLAPRNPLYSPDRYPKDDWNNLFSFSDPWNWNQPEVFRPTVPETEGPVFDNSLVTNVTAQLGGTAHLQCKVLNIRDKDNPVSVTQLSPCIGGQMRLESLRETWMFLIKGVLDPTSGLEHFVLRQFGFYQRCEIFIASPTWRYRLDPHYQVSPTKRWGHLCMPGKSWTSRFDCSKAF